MPTPPQRHPSRDPRPTEYQVHEGGTAGHWKGGVEISGAGFYEHDELEHATAYEKYEGEGHALTKPAQGRLFDADKHEAANRDMLGRQRFPSGREALPSEAASIRTKALKDSVIPTSHLQSRENRQETSVFSHNEDQPWEGSGMSGWYRGPATKDARDVIAVDPNSGHGTSNTFIHEAGHRRHLGETRAYSEYVNHPNMMPMDPLKEGVADAYVDRYGGPNSTQVRPMKEDIEETGGESKFTSYRFTGYSTDPEAGHRRGWGADHRALYAAVRGHASETGEQAFYVPRGRDVREQPGIAGYGGGDSATLDATMHHLLSAGPHARQALQDTGLEEAGDLMARRHQDRRLMSEGQSVQESLFTELKGMKTGKVHGYSPRLDAMPEAKSDEEFQQHYEVLHQDMDRLEQGAGEDIWPQHMSKNQLGEKPRTQGDISASLGVHRDQAKKLGFPVL